MIINAHSHIFHENSRSEFYADACIDFFSKAANMSKEVFMQIPNIDASLNPNAEFLVKTMDAAGIDKALSDHSCSSINCFQTDLRSYNGRLDTCIACRIYNFV